MSPRAQEVLDWARRRFGPGPFQPNAQPFDPARLFAYPRDTYPRVVAWLMVNRHTRRLRVKTEADYCGWRKCHTEHFWAWYALDVETP